MHLDLNTTTAQCSRKSSCCSLNRRSMWKSFSDGDSLYRFVCLWSVYFSTRRSAIADKPRL